MPKIPESVLVVVYTPLGDVLLLERADHPGYWQSVTGSRDSHTEPLIETARREVWEETGIHVAGLRGAPPPHRAQEQPCLEDWNRSSVYDIYPQWRHRYAPGVVHNTEHVFGLRVPQPVAITLSPREHLQSVWLPIDRAARQCFSPSNAQAIMALASRL